MNQFLIDSAVDGLSNLLFLRSLSRRVRVFNKSKFPLPAYKHMFDSGMDVQANIDEPILVSAGKCATIGTGLYFAIPPGLEIQVRSRSGLAHKHQVAVLNSPGTIDSPYRGELGIIFYNHGSEPYTINPGDRIAQIVLCPILICEWDEVADEESLDATSRGEGGFGSTGVGHTPNTDEVPINCAAGLTGPIGAQGTLVYAAGANGPAGPHEDN